MILTLEEIGKANKAAQIDGIVAGTCSGFLSGFLTTRVFRQSRNIGFLSGFMTGIIGGYLFTQASLGSHLAAANLAKLTLKQSLSPESTNEFVQTNGNNNLSSSAVDAPGLARWENEFESGSNGLETLKDKYNSTSGNH